MEGAKLREGGRLVERGRLGKEGGWGGRLREGRLMERGRLGEISEGRRLRREAVEEKAIRREVWRDGGRKERRREEVTVSART